MIMKKEQEARRSRRFEVEGDVHVKVLFTKSNDLKSVKAKLKNAGLGGLFIETKDLSVGVRPHTVRPLLVHALSRPHPS